TNRPTNANFFCHKPPRADRALAEATTARLAPRYAEAGIDVPDLDLTEPFPPFGPDHLACLKAAPPAVVSFHFGLPEGAAVAELKELGCTILCSATSVDEARFLEAQGVDAIIAQGWEAGGHRGAFEIESVDAGVGLFALLPQIVDAVDLPVIAAGGIADGRGIAAAFALGADGVQIGTAFLTCPEATATPLHKQVVREGRDTSTRLSRSGSGRPARAHRTGFTDEMAPLELPDYPLMYGLANPLKAAENTGESIEYQFLLYGQAAALSQEMPAAALLQHLAAEGQAAMGRLSDP
ncbi:MAG: nitronate monooxygenase, partial [Pseudomonadota bacterium]